MKSRSLRSWTFCTLKHPVFSMLVFYPVRWEGRCAESEEISYRDRYIRYRNQLGLLRFTAARPCSTNNPSASAPPLTIHPPLFRRVHNKWKIESSLLTLLFYTFCVDLSFNYSLPPSLYLSLTHTHSHIRLTRSKGNFLLFNFVILFKLFITPQ